MDDLLAELTALETELHHPGATCTRTRLERLLHPDFHEVGRSGTRYTRQVVIDFLADRTSLPQVVAYDHRLERLADEADLDPAFARKFLNFIISEVIRHHERHLGNNLQGD